MLCPSQQLLRTSQFSLTHFQALLEKRHFPSQRLWAPMPCFIQCASCPSYTSTNNCFKNHILSQTSLQFNSSCFHFPVLTLVMEPFSTDQTQPNNKRTLKDAPQQILGQLQSITERGKKTTTKKTITTSNKKRKMSSLFFSVQVNLFMLKSETGTEIGHSTCLCHPLYRSL